MKKLASVLTLLALLPAALPANAVTAAPGPRQAPLEIRVTKIKYPNPDKPRVYIMSNGLCDLKTTLTHEASAEGDTLVVTFTVHARPCKPQEFSHYQSFTANVDLKKEAASVGITADRPKLKANARVTYE